MGRNFSSIKIGELIEQLQGAMEEYGPDVEVVCTADYGDHCHTEQALPLRGEVSERKVHESGYSNSGWALNDENADEDDDEENEQKVVVLT